MIKKILISFAFLAIVLPTPSFAFWMWTPETGKWVNPKYAVKDTPAEQLNLILEAFEAKQFKETIAECQKLIRHYPKSKEAAEAQYYIGRAYEAQNEYFHAHEAYQKVITMYPFSERAGEIVERQFNIAEAILEGKQDQSWIQTVVGSNDKVLEIFRDVIKNAPYGKYAAPSQYKIGLYLKERGLFQEARDEFEKTMNDYPNTEWARAAKYQIAVSDAERSSAAPYDQKITQIAATEFEEFIKSHPETELSASAKKQLQSLRQKEAENSFLIAQFYEKQKNYDAAKIYYNTILDQYEDTPWAVKALERVQVLKGK